ncbi:hypothetical protein NLM33_33325 [Bradyrhizobium sp. CCGUVB1N3]|uniref:hypothetical protein n=1 Tax=Bradyrhizobium sp. CCGUVB1N3 TaxID=2949629 RepID=UPI0020B25C13|nr:hypothetical protein [Bradyrhizobium sp. CCGUVB1N3]MCP3475207.1 hypothetical protein [Bradyrhizobium sp. CCGUVB1N3]
MQIVVLPDELAKRAITFKSKRSAEIGTQKAVCPLRNAGPPGLWHLPVKDVWESRHKSAKT